MSLETASLRLGSEWSAQIVSRMLQQRRADLMEPAELSVLLQSVSPPIQIASGETRY